MSRVVTLTLATLLLAFALFACQSRPTSLPPTVAVSATPNPDSTPVPPGAEPLEPQTIKPPNNPTAASPLEATPPPGSTRDWPTPDPTVPLSTEVPPPMPELQFEEDVLNILLMGRDALSPTNNIHIYRTDVIIVASINTRDASVTLLTLPRDLWVYIPGWTMQRLNTAASHGDQIGYSGGGPALLRDTILYNFGIPIQRWARVDFDGYKEVIDILGGVEVPVTCALQDWRLKDPDLDDQNADNWELFTLETGVRHMDGDLALWYSRTRRLSGGDFDRSRRQHQVLRAMFDKSMSLDALRHIPNLYTEYTRIVETDLTLKDATGLAPLALKLDQARIKSRFIGRDQTTGWVTPGNASVLLPDREAVAKLLAETFQPASGGSRGAITGPLLARTPPKVEVWNGTARKDLDRLAADNLEWSGIVPVIAKADARNYSTTLIYDFTASPKGSILPDLKRIFKVPDTSVISSPDPSAPYPYRVILGADYDTCLYFLPAPKATPTPGPPSGPEVPGAYTATRLLTATPTVDGDLKDWPALRYTAKKFPAGVENWTGPADLTVEWDVAWNDSTLFLAALISDDVFVQEADAEHVLLGDGVELLFDLDLAGDSNSRELNADDYQIALSPGRLTASAPVPPWAYRWFPVGKKNPLPEVVLASRLVEGGYILEAAIPWTVLDHRPGQGEVLGFLLTVSDNDHTGTTQLDTLASELAGATLDDPGSWGRLTLSPPEGE